MSVDLIVVVMTLIVGGVAMYRLQEWADNLKRQAQMQVAEPALLKVVDVVVDAPKMIMGRAD